MPPTSDVAVPDGTIHRQTDGIRSRLAEWSLTWALAIVTSALALSAAAGMVVTRGAFTYAIDDAYIHLSMAEQILRGEYGINPGEPAAASSSVLYPFLLAALMRLGFGASGPLLINMAALALSVVCLAAIVDHVLGKDRDALPRRAFLIVAICLAFNLPGLALMGMENGPQVALTLAGLLGIFRLDAASRPPRWWLAVLVLAPLVRYEGVSLLAAGAGLLFAKGRIREAAAVLTLSIGSLLGFSLYLHSLGLPFLPSSVLVKGAEAGLTGGANLVSALLANAANNLRTGFGGMSAACIGLLLLHLFRNRSRLRPPLAVDDQVVIVAAFILTTHLVVGRFESPGNRYSLYAVLCGVIAVVIAYRHVVQTLLVAPLGPVAKGTALAVAAGVMVGEAFLSGTGAGNIRYQQFQTHRFVTDFWRAPIAVIDLGWVSFRNEHYVLDLWGLGSDKARQARSAPVPTLALGALVEEKGVAAAAIYDSWLPLRPDAWIPVARMRLDIPLVTSADDTVTFYATSVQSAPALRAALQAFGPTLPAGASLHFQ